MKTIIAGMRDFHDYKPVMRAIKKAALVGITVDELVCGMADGVDMTAFFWAKMCRIPVAKYYADWIGQGKAAGAIRNGKMAAYADALIAVWDGKSPGTGNMIDQMRLLGKRLIVYDVTSEPSETPTAPSPSD